MGPPICDLFSSAPRTGVIEAALVLIRMPLIEWISIARFPGYMKPLTRGGEVSIFFKKELLCCVLASDLN